MLAISIPIVHGPWSIVIVHSPESGVKNREPWNRPYGNYIKILIETGKKRKLITGPNNAPKITSLG